MKEIRVYVPSRDKDGKDLSEDQKSQLYIEALGTMVDLFGGCTRTAGYGVWLDENHKPISEEVTVLSSYSTEDITVDQHHALESLGEFIKRVGQQQCTLISIKPVDEVMFI